MEVITSHTNADFDTFSSMVAAKRLYPEAHIVFSGSVEKKVVDAMEKVPLPYKFEKLKDIDLEKVTRLILVDARHPARLGGFKGVALKPGMDIRIYDHHPPSEGVLKGTVEVIEKRGASATVLTEVLRREGLVPTPDEATLLMAGIYEDTGSLSYQSTTTEDFEAAGYLLSCGARLRFVSDLLRREMTAKEVSLLNEFLHSETRYRVGGVEVVIAEAGLEDFKGDISALAHKIRDIEGMDCLFVLADAGDRVHMIARSASPQADVGAVARLLSGGGHAAAASATFKDLTLTQVKERLLAAVRSVFAPLVRAADIMSCPPITVTPDMSVKDAVDAMRKYNINAAPAIKGRSCLGIITRQVADKAAHHGLGNARVGDFMTTEFITAASGAPVEEVREMVMSRGQRLLPVLEDKSLVGVITRADLIKLLQEGLSETPAVRRRQLANLMSERLPGWLLEMLRTAGEIAEGLGVRAFAVGGFIRDLVMRRENIDVDIVIEGGDGIHFAEGLAERFGCRVRAHARFRTAVVIFPDGYKLDVATARLEYYERPGALPIVERSSLKLDLFRRDFIINTLAVSLNPPRFGELIDFFGAEKDIKDKRIRVLHNLSFVEDPTRALRAARFSEKFGFSIDNHTLYLMKNAVRLGVFKKVSGPRLLEEFKSILEEESAAKTLNVLHRTGVLGLIHKDLTWDMDREALFERTRETMAWHRLLYTGDSPLQWLTLYLALTDPLSAAEFGALARHFSISGRKMMEVIAGRGDALRALGRLETGGVLKNSAVYGLLKPLPLETVLYIMAKTGNEATRKAIAFYITRLKTITPEMTGKDLKRMGLQGAQIGEMLKAVLKKRLDFELHTRADEEEFVLRCLAKRKG